MRVVDIEDEIKDLVNYTTAADQDFSANSLRRSLNRRYEAEVLLGQQHGRRIWFHKTQDFTWTSGSATLTLPSTVDQAAIIRLADVTDSDPGASLPSFVFFKDNKTLQWGSTSPGSDRTIRATYFARPAPLVNDNDEPDLIPPEMRMLLVWSTAVYLRTKADEGAPGQWLTELNDARLTYWKWISKNRPQMDTQTGVPYDITIDGAQVSQDGSSINQDNN